MRSKSTPTPYFGLVQTNNYRRLNTLVGKSKTKSFHGSSSIHGADTDSLTADSGNTSNSDVESTVLDYCDSDEQCYPETHASDSVSESSYCAAPLNQPLYEKEADRRDGPSAAAIDDLQAVDLSVKSTAITAIHEVSKHNAVIPAVPSSSPMVAKPVAPPLSSSTNYSTALVPTSKSATSISQMSHLKQEPMETEDGGLVEMNKCHQCSYCFRIFMREKNLWNHIQSVHSKVTEQKKKYTYKCSECSYTSNHYSNWYIHLRIHTGEKPYWCAGCNKRFTQGSTLKLHVNSVHGRDKLQQYYRLDHKSGKRNLTPYLAKARADAAAHRTDDVNKFQPLKLEGPTQQSPFMPFNMNMNVNLNLNNKFSHLVGQQQMNKYFQQSQLMLPFHQAPILFVPTPAIHFAKSLHNGSLPNGHNPKPSFPAITDNEPNQQLLQFFAGTGMAGHPISKSNLDPLPSPQIQEIPEKKLQNGIEKSSDIRSSLSSLFGLDTCKMRNVEGMPLSHHENGISPLALPPPPPPGQQHHSIMGQHEVHEIKSMSGKDALREALKQPSLASLAKPIIPMSPHIMSSPKPEDGSTSSSVSSISSHSHLHAAMNGKAASMSPTTSTTTNTPMFTTENRNLSTNGATLASLISQKAADLQQPSTTSTNPSATDSMANSCVPDCKHAAKLKDLRMNVLKLLNVLVDLPFKVKEVDMESDRVDNLLKEVIQCNAEMKSQ